MGYTQKKIYAPDFYVIYEADDESITWRNSSVKFRLGRLGLVEKQPEYALK